MEQDDGSSAVIEMIPDGDGDSPTTAPEPKMIESKAKHELVPQLRFPRGYHFLPTDLELVDFYLRRKIEGRELPLDIFIEIELLKWEPAKLIEEHKAFGEDRYFFFTKRESSSSNKVGQPRRKVKEDEGRVAASWKATGSVLVIRRPGTGEVVGTRRMLTYSSGCPDEDKYSMKEYVLEGSKMEDYVLCTIKEKERWNANQNKDKNASGGKDKKRKRGTDTCVEPKTTKRKKKTATSQPQETQEQQQQQEITSDISSDPPPLLGHEQDDHHQALPVEEDIMAFEEIQAPHEDSVGGHQPYYHDASMQQETMTWDGPGEQPLMAHQRQGYQASTEEQIHTLDGQNMLEHQFAPMAQDRPQYLMFQYQGHQQPQNTHELLSPYRYCSVPYQLLQHPFQYGFRTQGFHRDVTGTLQDVPPFSPESGKPLTTSPDSVLGGPDPGLPSENPPPHSDSDAGMMIGVTSPVVPQVTSYGSAADHQFDPIHFMGKNFHDNLAGNGSSSDVTMVPDQGSNQALHKCQHGSMQYQLSQHSFQYMFGTPGFHGDITGRVQNVPPSLPESGKAPGTSPDSMLGGPDPGLPSEKAYPYSDSDAGMMHGVASTVATNYDSAADHQFNPVDLQGHNFGDNLAGNGGGSHVAMGLPDQDSNPALHTCHHHGVQWWCGEQQGVDMGSCLNCATECALYHST